MVDGVSNKLEAPVVVSFGIDNEGAVLEEDSAVVAAGDRLGRPEVDTVVVAKSVLLAADVDMFVLPEESVLLESPVLLETSELLEETAADAEDDCEKISDELAEDAPDEESLVGEVEAIVVSVKLLSLVEPKPLELALSDVSPVLDDEASSVEENANVLNDCTSVEEDAAVLDVETSIDEVLIFDVKDADTEGIGPLVVMTDVTNVLGFVMAVVDGAAVDVFSNDEDASSEEESDSDSVLELPSPLPLLT